MIAPIWLTWHNHARSRSLSRLLGVQLLVYERRKHGAIRHWEGLWWTIWQLIRGRPRVIYLQNSFLLLLVCALYRRATGSHVLSLIADCHNKSLRRQINGPMGAIFWHLKRFSFNAVDLIIVSNRLLVPEAMRLCQNVVTLIDPLPEMGDIGDHPRRFDLNRPYVLFVCSHERDEPISLMLSVALRILTETELCIVVTGVVPSGSPFLSLVQSPRVIIPGYLPWCEYCQLMWHAAIVVVLTEDKDCLCCGAYEAVQCTIPLVLPDHPILREVFDGCAEFAPLEIKALFDAIIRVSRSVNDVGYINNARSTLQRRFDGELAALVARQASGCLR
ncbi:MAG: glycosyltransferase [bacterium]|nr:glycosyltransferase [bacterium]